MFGAKMKYVVFYSHKGEEIIIFPKVIQHSVMAENVEDSSFGSMRPISGGFVVNGLCVGESLSLRMKSRGEKDTALIPRMLDIEECIDDEVMHTTENKKHVVSKNKAKRLRKKI